MNINDIIENLFELRKQDNGDFVIYFSGDVMKRLVNCKDVSMEFIENYYIQEKDFFEGNEIEYEEVDMGQLVDEYVREGLWDWKKEVKEYVGN